MDTAVELLLSGIARTTICTTLAALATLLLLPILGIRSPRVHRMAWVLVIVQGWLLIPVTFTVSTPNLSPTPELIVTETHQFESSTTDLSSVVEPTFSRSVWQLYGSQAITAFWLLGTLAVLGFYLKRYHSLTNNITLGHASESDEWQEEWRQATEAVSPKSNVRFRITGNIGPLLCFVPYVYLVLVPRLLWGSLSRIDRLAILRHELAHLRRGDLWKNLAIRLLALPQWFNPLVWLAIRRFEEAGEWACDEEVLESTGIVNTGYANTLLHVAGFSTDTPCGAVAATGGVLTRRVTRLLSSTDKEVSKMKNLIVPFLLLGLAVTQVVRIESVQAEQATVIQSDTEQDLDITQTLEARAQAMAEWRKQEYVIDPPDILLIEGVKLIPKSPHKLVTFDAVLVRVEGVLPDQPIDDAYNVDADGSINFGKTYGRVKVANDTVEKAEERVRAHLAKKFTGVEVSLSLLQSNVAQQVTGQHLVGPDGRVNLGIYGTVQVAGLTLQEVRAAVEKQLSHKLKSPEVFVDVLAYNSKVYYIVLQGGGSGDNVVRLPLTGNETVLDAVASIGGISQVSSAKIWLAAPAPNGVGREMILPVNWDDITRGGSTDTNYQLMPGDRLFIAEDRHQEERESPPLPPPVPPTPVAPPTEVQLSESNSLSLLLGENQADEEIQVVWTCQIIEDLENNFAEIDGLKTGDKVICDAGSIEGLIRVLQKNDLARIIANPTVTSFIGKRSAFYVGPADQNASLDSDQQSIEVKTSFSTKQDRLSFSTQAIFKSGTQKFERNIKSDVQEGEACIARLHRDSGTNGKSPQIYLVLKWEYVK